MGFVPLGLMMVVALAQVVTSTSRVAPVEFSDLAYPVIGVGAVVSAR